MKKLAFCKISGMFEISERTLIPNFFVINAQNITIKAYNKNVKIISQLLKAILKLKNPS